MQASGVVDLEGNRIPHSELISHALLNVNTRSMAANVGDNAEKFIVRAGGYVNEYPRRNEEGAVSPGTSEDPNHLMGCFPLLFPYGCGGFETPRSRPVSYESHSKWALQYGDKQFRLDHQFIFQIFGILQKRAICASTALKMTRSDYVRQINAIQQLGLKDFDVAAAEESRHVPFSNPVMRSLMNHLHTVQSSVAGTDSSRTSVRSKIWSLIATKNPPNLWITLNPSNINNPIAQVFAGESLDLDNFDAKRALNAKGRAENMARDPYAAAKFFHFVIVATLETIFGISVSRSSITRRKGTFGKVNAYVGMVETQGRGMLRLHLILWLAGGPNPRMMRECLLSEEFRQKMVDFIAVNIKVDVGMNAESFLKLPVKPAVTFNRPIPPSDPQYTIKSWERMKLVLRAVQVHSCEIGRCIIAKKKRLVCKN